MFIKVAYVLSSTKLHIYFFFFHLTLTAKKDTWPFLWVIDSFMLNFVNNSGKKCYGELIDKLYAIKCQSFKLVFVCSTFCIWEKPLISPKLSKAESWADVFSLDLVETLTDLKESQVTKPLMLTEASRYVQSFSPLRWFLAFHIVPRFTHQRRFKHYLMQLLFPPHCFLCQYEIHVVRVAV